jgi:HTH-type transcriptional regulator, competence development regulator
MTQAERNLAFGTKILELRTALGLSQRKLGEQVSLSSGFLSRLERGLYDPPSEDKIKALAAALRTNPDSLLGLAGRASSDVTAQIAKKPVQMAQGVRQLSLLDEDSLPLAIAFFAIIALLFMSANSEKPPRTEEYKRKWREAFTKFRRETAHFSPQEQKVLIAEMKRLIIEWEKTVP